MSKNKIIIKSNKLEKYIHVGILSLMLVFLLWILYVISIYNI